MNLVRIKSQQVAKVLGYTINAVLPSLDRCCVRSANVLLDRMLCMHAVAACSYGFDRSIALQWIEQEELTPELSVIEREFLEKGVGSIDQFQVQIEGMFALAWCLRIVPDLDFSRKCNDDFVMRLPNLKQFETAQTLRLNMLSREAAEVIQKTDLSYCLHWAVQQALFSNAPIPGKLPAYVIVERRRALEWATSEEKWEDVILDT